MSRSAGRRESFPDERSSNWAELIQPQFPRQASPAKSNLIAPNPTFSRKKKIVYFYGPTPNQPKSTHQLT
jgi:hypothetical protein